MAPHLVKLYQDEKNKGKAMETNFIESAGVSNAHLASQDDGQFLDFEHIDDFNI